MRLMGQTRCSSASPRSARHGTARRLARDPCLTRSALVEVPGDALSSRLWEVRSGRRLGMKTPKHPPRVLDAAILGEAKSAYGDAGTRPVAVVGDEWGTLYVLNLDDDLDGPDQRRGSMPVTVSEDMPESLLSAVLVLPWARGDLGNWSSGDLRWHALRWW